CDQATCSYPHTSNDESIPPTASSTVFSRYSMQPFGALYIQYSGVFRVRYTLWLRRCPLLFRSNDRHMCLSPVLIYGTYQSGLVGYTSSSTRKTWRQSSTRDR